MHNHGGGVYALPRGAARLKVAPRAIACMITSQTRRPPHTFPTPAHGLRSWEPGSETGLRYRRTLSRCQAGISLCRPSRGLLEAARPIGQLKSRHVAFVVEPDLYGMTFACRVGPPHAISVEDQIGHVAVTRLFDAMERL